MPRVAEGKHRALIRCQRGRNDDTFIPKPGTGRKRLSVNSMSTALRFTRAAFGAVQRASPGLAARWAERLFCSPPRRPISERMAAWLAGGRRFDLTVGRRRVAAWSWGERGTGVVAVHGRGGHGRAVVRW